MADDADIANEYLEKAIFYALDKRQHSNNAAKTVSKLCKQCQEEIPQNRRELGFQFCVDCATDLEKINSRFANF